MTTVCEGLEARAREELFINIQPIQAAGRLTSDAMKALIAYGDGYSTCDNCLKPFRLDKITRPNIAGFHDELARFIGVDVARAMPGARRGFQATCHTLVRPGDAVLLSSLCHYSELLAVESAGGVPREVPLDKNNLITGEAVAATIAEVKKELGQLPVLAMIDQVDYMFGNRHDIEGAAKACREHGIPILCNGAYTVGVMPVDAKALGVDLVTGSGHKSMASPAPSGVLGANGEAAEKVFRTTAIETDRTKRRFGIKEVELLGCTLMGGNMLAMMASFPAVCERVKSWDDELAKVNHFCEQFMRIEGNRVLSEMPRRHTLTKVDSTGSFDKVAQTHKKKGFFLTKELRNRGIVGVFPGATHEWKLNTYGLTWDQVRHVADAFLEIAEKYKLAIN